MPNSLRESCRRPTYDQLDRLLDKEDEVGLCFSANFLRNHGVGVEPIYKRLWAASA